MAFVEKYRPAVVLLDLGLPPDPDGTTEGFAILNEILSITPDTKIIVASGHGARESAIRAISEGAYDFYQKPVDADEIGFIVDRAFRLYDLEQENKKLQQREETTRLPGLVTASEQMEQVCSVIERVSPTSVSVLLLGGSGTGKELLARALHDLSDRNNMPFVAINCGAIPENLIESELFGFEKGAFTGAVQQVKGRFERAHGGTLFIDEVGDIPTGVQVKLLRAIQEQAFERVGGTEIIQVDTRIIAATNRDLENLVKTGKFREDLYYRLNVVSVIVPPLRERRSDIAPLINHFLQKFSDENQKKMKRASKEALDLLMKYDYPGNVRELENIIEQAVVLSRGELITSDDLPLTVQEKQSEQELSTGDLEERVAAYEQKLIQQALDKTGGVQTKAAELLGLSERNLRYKLKKHGMK